MGNLAALAMDQRFIDLDLNRQWLPQRVAEVAAAAGTVTGTPAVEENEHQFGRGSAFCHRGHRGWPASPIMAVDLRHSVTPGDGFVMAPGYRNFDPVPAGEAVARDNKGPVISRRRFNTRK